MNILIICKRYYTNKDLIQDQFGRLYHLPYQWSKNHNVLVLALNYKNQKNDHIDNKTLKVISVNSKLFKYNAFHMFQTCTNHARLFSANIIITSGDIITGVIGAQIAKKFSIPWVFDVYDDYRLFKINRLSGLSAFYPYLIKRADGVLSASNTLFEQCSIWNTRTIIARNGYDPKLFKATDKLESRKRLNISPQTKLLVYTGTIDERIDWPLIVDTVSSLHKHDSSILLIHAGTRTIKQSSSYAWLKSVGHISQLEISLYIQAADICIAPYKVHNKLSSTSNPCKAAEYLACERPVVASNIEEFKRLLPYGVRLYKAEDPSDALKKMHAQLKKPCKTQPDIELSWEIIATKVELLLEQICRSKNANRKGLSE